MRINVIETFAAAAAAAVDQARDEADRELSVHAFPAHRLPVFESKWNALCKRADKLGLQPPEWMAVRSEERTWRETRSDGREVTVTDRFLVVAVRARPVVLPGFRFVATIQHTEAGNILRTVPAWTEPMPKEYREAAASWCDHCQTSRQRNETYVVRHDNGKMMRVGRNCLADFVASDRDGTSVAAQMNWATSFASLLDDLEGWGGIRGGEATLPIGKFVAQVARVIIEEGWISRGKARDQGGTSSADLAMDVIRAHERPTPHNGWYRDARFTVVDADIELAKQAVRWARDIDPDTDSDYLHNSRVACSFDFITHKEAGIVGSVVSAYRRHVEGIAAAAREATLPPRGRRYVGAIGDKFGRKLSKADKDKGTAAHDAIDAVVVAVRHFDNDWGSTTAVVFERTTQGERDVFVWWATSAPCVELGEAVRVVGTVKKHAEYKGEKQTVLTRCVVAPLQVAVAA